VFTSIDLLSDDAIAIEMAIDEIQDELVIVVIFVLKDHRHVVYQSDSI
jgi:hypothetical protein